jgi:hypothetical protein
MAASLPPENDSLALNYLLQDFVGADEGILKAGATRLREGGWAAGKPMI